MAEHWVLGYAAKLHDRAEPLIVMGKQQVVTSEDFSTEIKELAQTLGDNFRATIEHIEAKGNLLWYYKVNRGVTHMLLVNNCISYRPVNVFFLRVIGLLASVEDRSNNEQLRDFVRGAEEALITVESQAKQASTQEAIRMETSTARQLNDQVGQSAASIDPLEQQSGQIVYKEDLVYDTASSCRIQLGMLIGILIASLIVFIVVYEEEK